MTDALQAIVTYLAADTDVKALVWEGDAGASVRVWGQELPEAENESMPRRNVVVSSSPGTGAYGTVDLERLSIEVACYGETPLDAQTLRLAVRDALKACVRKKIGSVLIHYAVPASAPSAQRDPDTKWPLLVEGWQCLASELTAA